MADKRYAAGVLRGILQNQYEPTQRERALRGPAVPVRICTEAVGDIWVASLKDASLSEKRGRVWTPSELDAVRGDRDLARVVAECKAIFDGVVAA